MVLLSASRAEGSSSSHQGAHSNRLWQSKKANSRQKGSTSSTSSSAMRPQRRSLSNLFRSSFPPNKPQQQQPQQGLRRLGSFLNTRRSLPATLESRGSDVEAQHAERRLQNTQILTTTATFHEDEEEKRVTNPENATLRENGNLAVAPSCSATAILQHSYMFCTSPTSYDYDEQEEDSFKSSRRRLPDDPTIQESIECIFASQLQEGLPHLLLDDDEDEEEDTYFSKFHSHKPPMAPSSLHQSIMKNRQQHYSGSTHFNHSHHVEPSRQRSKSRRRTAGSLVHLRTYDPTAVDDDKDDVEHAEKVLEHALADAASSSCAAACPCHLQSWPLLEPQHWPQGELLLRPSKGTRVKGIRFSSKQEYLWKPSSITACCTGGVEHHHHGGDNTSACWPIALKRHWQQEGIRHPAMTESDMVLSEMPLCAQCCILPINNGNEAEGEALVTDFESDLFSGTLLLRVRHAVGTTPEPYRDDRGYFCGMNRRYQAVISGKFKRAFPFTECMTGFQLERPCGKLPPKWIVQSTLKVVSFFAPQLQVRLDGPKPSTLTPLGSTPQCVIVTNDDDGGHKIDIEANHEEPTDATRTLLGESIDHSSSMKRARFRKRNFDKLFAQKSTLVQADPSKTYTFEFLQHMFNFSDFSIELGPVMGSIGLAEILNGQPLQIMACHKAEKLWSFDIWHNSLLEDAKRNDSQRKLSQ